MDDEFVGATCQPKTEQCCRYLAFTNGWECLKLYAELRASIDKCVEQGKFNATGDNCEGVQC